MRERLKEGHVNRSVCGREVNKSGFALIFRRVAIMVGPHYVLEGRALKGIVRAVYHHSIPEARP